MATDNRERDVLELERRFWNTMKTKDGRSAGRMTDDGCIIVGAQGVSAIDPKSMETMMGDGKWLCALHTESLSGDPYGRDKTKSA